MTVISHSYLNGLLRADVLLRNYSPWSI